MSIILCIDDDPLALTVLSEQIAALGHSVLCAETPTGALAHLAQHRVDVVVTDFVLPGMNGAELLSVVRDAGYQCPFIIVTAHASVEHAVSSMRAGAVTYLSKPVMRSQLEVALGQALELVALREEVDTLRAEVSSSQMTRRILGNSPALRGVMRTIASVASSRATVLIEGESGTGKELFARVLHDLSERGRRPFVRLNCAALPEGLIESALFGHERGAFTGAMKRSEGAFERADGGTLLLDEVSEMRLDLQAKLLRVLQEQEFERVGGSSMLRVDVRVIATTNRDLAAEAGAGTFRQDLYYRLNVVHLRIPPLRERPDDIVVLANAFMHRFAEEAKRPVERIDTSCLEQLCALPWPGNVRELEHAVYRAVLLSEGPVLTWSAFAGSGRGLPGGPTVADRHVANSPAAMPQVGGRSTEGFVAAGAPTRVVVPAGVPGVAPVLLHTYDLAEAEAALIRGALADSRGNRTRAASMLGINVRTLRRKLAAGVPGLEAPTDEGDADEDNTAGFTERDVPIPMTSDVFESTDIYGDTSPRDLLPPAAHRSEPAPRVARDNAFR